MNYNHFTIRYIECLEKHLKITTLDGETNFFPDFVTANNIKDLKDALYLVWDDSHTAVELLVQKKEAKLQAALFGLVENFDLAIKAGYMIADRIVLIDFIYQRILQDLEKLDKNVLGEVARNLVKMKSLAQEGRFVIIPSPFYWNSDTKIFLAEASKKYSLTPDTVSLLNVLSICRICNLQPYTIAEDKIDFDRLLNNDIDLTGLASMTVSLSSYHSIIAGLMSQKILKISELEYIGDIPVDKYAAEIRDSENFYNEYLRLITHNDAMNFENNFEELHKEIVRALKEENVTKAKKILDSISKISSVGTAGVAMAGTVTVISAPILIGAAAVTLGSSIASMFAPSGNKENVVISVLKKLGTT